MNVLGGIQVTWEQLAHFGGSEREDTLKTSKSFFTVLPDAGLLLISKEIVIYNSCGTKELTEHLPVRGGFHEHTGQKVQVTLTCPSALYSSAKGGNR